MPNPKNYQESLLKMQIHGLHSQTSCQSRTDTYVVIHLDFKDLLQKKKNPQKTETVISSLKNILIRCWKIPFWICQNITKSSFILLRCQKNVLLLHSQPWPSLPAPAPLSSLTKAWNSDKWPCVIWVCSNQHLTATLSCYGHESWDWWHPFFPVRCGGLNY